MRTAVRDVSIESYHVMGPKLGEQQRRIVSYLAKYAHRDFTRAELAEGLGLPVSSVCGRVKELMQAHILVEGQRRPDRRTGIASHPLRLAPAQQALDLEAA
jgi:hypothetical protein